MEIICDTGLIITSDDIDIINEKMTAYYEDNFTEKRQYNDADEFFEDYLGCKLISDPQGVAKDIFSNRHKNIDGYPLDKLLYFYVVPLNNKANLVKKAYTDITEILREVKMKLLPIKRFLPPKFNFEERLARIEVGIIVPEAPHFSSVEEEWEMMEK